MSADTTRSRWQTLPTLCVLGAGLVVVAVVWVLSCRWSFSEQARAAQALGFEHPHVLPWMLDALAAALALVALAAALAGQSAGLARLGVFLALSGSVWANAAGVSIRSGGDPKHDAITMAAIAPISAFAALEVLLGKIRRLVLWLRGEPAPAAIPALRLVRLLLAPRTSFCEWRTAVLERTTPIKPAVSQDTLPETAGGAVPGQATPGQGEPQLRSALPGRPDLAEGAASGPGTAGREGSASRYGQTPPSPALALVSGSHQDARSKTAVPAVSGQPSRSAVSVRADSGPDGGPDTVAGHLADSQTSGVLAPRTDTQDSVSGQPTETSGQSESEQPDKVSAALLSGLSVREVARSTGQTKSHVEKRRGELVAAGQLPARGRP